MPKMYVNICKQCNKEYKNTSKIFCSKKCHNVFLRTNEEQIKRSSEQLLKLKIEYEKNNGKPMGFKRGELNPSANPKRREEIRLQRLGKKLSKRTKLKIARSMREALKNPILRKKWSDNKIGKKLPEETIKKMKEAWAKKPRKISTLLNKADSVYSKYIRNKYADEFGYVACFTCGAKHPIKEIDNGHYVSRMFKSVRFYEKNTHPQCIRCNRFMEGNKDVYSLKLIEKYGAGILEELNKMRNEVKQFTPKELEEIIKKYEIREEN